MARSEHYVPLMDRFSAWWNGEDVPIHRAPEAPTQAVAIEIDEILEEDQQPWSAGRLSAMESVWGETFLEPGGERQARKLLALLTLDPRQSVLDLTAGLGGTALAISNRFGLWMDAFEPVEELAREGRRRCVMAGMGNRVAYQHVDFAEPSLPPGRYDAVYSRERLFSVENKQSLVEQCAGALKPNGSVLITDFVRADSVSAQDANDAWACHDGESAHLWSLRDYRVALTDQGLNMLLCSDISEDYLAMVSRAWARVPLQIRDKSLSRRKVSLLMEEGEIWLSRIRALESGQIGVGRIHAQKPA